MSQRHPSTRRAKPAASHEPDDLFVARVLHAGKWIEAHQQLLTVLLVVAGLAVAGLLYYRSYRRSLVEQAAQQLEVVYQSLSIQDSEGATRELVTFLERFSGTPYEGEARLLLGDLYLRTERPEQAEAVLEPIGASPRTPIELQAATLLATAYEQQGRDEDAERTHLRIAERSDLDFQVRDALAAAARIRQGRGDVAGAVELYERALESLDAEDPERGVYEMRIAEIRAVQGT
jgi:predicted negative regulator of RcsB-dependent stress response